MHRTATIRPAAGLPSDKPPAPRRWVIALAAAAVALAAVAVYHNSLDGAMVFDDDTAIAKNPAIRDLGDLRAVLFGGTSATVVGRPLLSLSLALNYAAGGLAVRGYHLVNIAIHAAAAVALFGLARRLLASPRVPEAYRGLATPLAFATALVWAVHPLQTESVTYIVQRAESLAGLFYLMTLYAAMRGAASPQPRGWNALAVAACLLGVATKETLATAPLMALACEAVFVTGSVRAALARRPWFYLALAGTWLALGALVWSSGGRAETAGFGYGVTAGQYALAQPGMILRYLRLVAWPAPLILDYGMRPLDTAGESAAFAAIVALILAATAWAVVRRPLWGFCGAWVFVILAPTSSVIPLVTQVGAEHRMYLPLAGAVALLVVGATAAGRAALAACPISDGRRWAVGWMLALTALAAGAATLGHLTLARNLDYRTTFDLTADTARKCPGNARARMSLAAEWLGRGRPDEAVREADAALALLPGYVEAYTNRGEARRRMGRRDLALADFDRALAIDPRHVTALNNRGILRQELARHDLAVEDFSRAIALRPGYAKAYYNRGGSHRAVGENAKALADYDRAIALDPAYGRAFRARARCQVDLGRYDAAWADAERARALGAPPDEAFMGNLRRAMPREE